MTKAVIKKNNTGQQAEILAWRYLKRQGLRMRTKNYHCRFGEIDLIMQEKNTLVFVEVRYRKNTQMCTPVESIDYFKQQKIIKTAEYYLAHHPSSLPCRFDVVSLTELNPENINWIPNAFHH
jgi:putative endonuclease